MERRALGKAGDIDLCRRNDVRNVADVGGDGKSASTQPVRLDLRGEGRHLRGETSRRRDLVQREHRRAELPERLVRQTAERVVGEIIAHGAPAAEGYLRASHQRGTLRHIGQPAEHILGGALPFRTDIVEKRGLALHDVGAAPAGISVSVMEPDVRRNMLAQVVCTHVHQLAGIQRAAPELR